MSKFMKNSKNKNLLQLSLLSSQILAYGIVCIVLSPPTARVADQVHFRPDLDPQIGILKSDPDPGSYCHLKHQFKHLNFFHIKHIFSDI